ncbi:Uncharacterised protein [Mycolicibacterium vanbaalenii]|uniref:Uncharacterized protein n=1 Tax=Mycolicibacterium vanbaalenii TaxID=110539 RepID=A0A5S9MUY6_MYCVN|nr:hypothetical protein [Mycolicibacterium vanbaalenii]CAA0081230.1 Uncharacterised protein [Mycolicibacterium vanbaalenii]
MSSALTFLNLFAPFALVATLVWAARRSGTLRLHLDQFDVAAPMGGRLFHDASATRHDPDIRARFEQQPIWPSSGVTGERR